MHEIGYHCTTVPKSTSIAAPVSTKLNFALKLDCGTAGSLPELKASEQDGQFK